MLDWFSRYRQRKRDLAAGVDADLITGNTKKFKLGFGLFGPGLLAMWLSGTGEVHGVLKEILLWLGGAAFLAGFFIVIWANQERAFLDKPDPKKPPSLFK